MAKAKLTKINALLLVISIFTIIIIHKQSQNFEYAKTSSTTNTSSYSSSLKLTQKLPSALIIGAAKCGTGTLLDFITIHPQVVGYNELHFFSRDWHYNKGKDWYRTEMPFSNENQITIEKSPTYLTDINSSERAYEMNPQMKIILIVCDPVVRAVSHYAMKKENRDDGNFVALLNKNLSDSEYFRELLYVDSKIQMANIKNSYIFKAGLYNEHLQKWIKYFPLEKILIINGKKFKTEPGIQMEKVQTYLNLQPLIKKEHFIFNQTKGFYCLTNPMTYQVKCMGKDKGRKHPIIDSAILNDMREIFRSDNINFFKLLNEKTPWWTI
jgi:hypothetical protein